MKNANKYTGGNVRKRHHCFLFNKDPNKINIILSFDNGNTNHPSLIFQAEKALSCRDYLPPTSELK